MEYIIFFIHLHWWPSRYWILNCVCRCRNVVQLGQDKFMLSLGPVKADSDAHAQSHAIFFAQVLQFLKTISSVEWVKKKITYRQLEHTTIRKTGTVKSFHSFWFSKFSPIKIGENSVLDQLIDLYSMIVVFVHSKPLDIKHTKMFTDPKETVHMGLAKLRHLIIIKQQQNL